MPTYVYLCEKCGHQFEQFQPISADPLTTCTKEACQQKRWGKGRVKRAISGGAGLIFKGSGFYITDYRSDDYKKKASAEKGGSTPSTPPAKTEAKAETKKPAAAKKD